jgi:hypothetical protein
LGKPAFRSTRLKDSKGNTATMRNGAHRLAFLRRPAKTLLGAKKSVVEALPFRQRRRFLRELR